MAVTAAVMAVCFAEGVWLLAAPAVEAGQGQTVGEVASNGVGSAADADDRSLDELEPKKKRYKLALLVLIIGLVVFFVFILVLALLRMVRFQRRRLRMGQKDEPTEYFDAWSHYRLEKDDDGDDSKPGTTEKNKK